MMITHTLATEFLKTSSKYPLGKNVLIIEDNADTAESLQLALVYEGFGVRSVQNRDEGLLALKKNIYQFILLDYFMPGLGAKDFLDAARQHAPIAKAILITAATDAEEKARELGLKYWLGKPIQPSNLIALLNKIG